MTRDTKDLSEILAKLPTQPASRAAEDAAIAAGIEAFQAGPQPRDKGARAFAGLAQRLFGWIDGNRMLAGAAATCSLMLAVTVMHYVGSDPTGVQETGIAALDKVPVIEPEPEKRLVAPAAPVIAEAPVPAAPAVVAGKSRRITVKPKVAALREAPPKPPADARRRTVVRRAPDRTRAPGAVVSETAGQGGCGREEAGEGVFRSGHCLKARGNRDGQSRLVSHAAG